MFPIKRLTAINLIVNLMIVKMALIDARAGGLCVAMIFLFEHGSDVVRRKRTEKIKRTEERV
ncbi:MAG: hypothetical protein ACLTXM_02615 [Enterococcus sp.]